MFCLTNSNRLIIYKYTFFVLVLIFIGKIVMKEIEFKGKAMEYFGIWLANILLTVVTIGIFSAWAKVRRLKYFFNNTKILEDSFAYHATGWQILKGRIIALVAILILGAGSAYIPSFSFISFLIIFFLLPFIINSSLRFNARMISYRNIKFNWHGNYKQTFLYFVLGPVISFLSLGFLHPLFTKYYYTYYANNHSYGTSRFSAYTTVKKYYLDAIKSGFLPVLFIFYSIIIYTIWDIASLMVWDIDYIDSMWISSGSEIERIISYNLNYNLGNYSNSFSNLLFILIPIIFLTNFIYRIFARNMLLRATILNNSNNKEISANFDSKLNPATYLWITISNAIVVPITLGLMSPWAQIRFYKYLSHSTKIEVIGDLNLFLDIEKKNLSSLGEEYAEMEGIEVNI
jgi:uncharacterized membrane protein YjgN (DUF898 family)